MTFARTSCKTFLILFLGLILFAGPGDRPILAQSGPGQAGLVIVQEEMPPLTFCVDLDGAGSTGIQLLAQTGLDFIADYGNSMGAAVCSIDGVGCTFPSQDCFCQCQGAECTYWSYHRLEPGGASWIYSQFGAGQTAVSPGSVEAWIWAEGESGSSALQPPDIGFVDICPGQSTSAAPTADPLNWPAYAGFATLLTLLIGAEIWRRSRTTD